MNITTIRVHKDLIKKLRKLELYPRETNEEILTRLIKTKRELHGDNKTKNLETPDASISEDKRKK